MLRKAYPDYDWIPWKFKSLPKLTSDSQVIRKALAYIEAELNLAKPEDWAGLSVSKLKKLKVFPIISRAGGLFKVLKQYRPGFEWDEVTFSEAKAIGWRTLRNALRRMFPNMDLFEDFTLSSELNLSYYIPCLSLAFDFQDSEDYDLAGEAGKIEVTLKEDLAKKVEADRMGITLVSVPFWWDRNISSLIATTLEKCGNLRTVIPEKLLKVASEVQPIPVKHLVRVT